jgi:hypothetical protein
MAIHFNDYPTELSIAQQNATAHINTVADAKKHIEISPDCAKIAILSLIVELNHIRKSTTQWYYDLSNVQNFKRTVSERLDYLISFKSDDFLYVQEINKFRAVLEQQNQVDATYNEILTYGVRLFNHDHQLDVKTHPNNVYPTELYGNYEKSDKVQKSRNFLRTSRGKLIAAQTAAVVLFLLFSFGPQESQ